MKMIPRGLIITFALLFLALLAGGFWLYQSQELEARAQAEADLQAIGRLKIGQIVQWRNSRLADAAVIMDSPFFIEGVQGFLNKPQTTETDFLLRRFRGLRDNYQYADILLVDLEGKIVLSLSGRGGMLHQEALEVLATAFRKHLPQLTDLHESSGMDYIHLSSIAPLFREDDNQPLGAVVLVSDASQFLFPLVQSWPLPNRTAETLLVRRDGDNVLFLNELRHQHDTALKLRIPLSQTDVPAVKAVLGQQGMVEGKDYRGVEVISYLIPVPDSPWFMVAKIDKSEAMQGWRNRSVLILALIGGVLIACAALLSFFWQRNAKAGYRALYESEKARRLSEARYATTLMSVGDGIIATDAEGCVQLLNPVAGKLTGWPHSEACGKKLEEVFQIVNEDTRQVVENPVTAVLRQGLVVGLANHTLLISRDGKEYPIADSGAPIYDENGEIGGVVLVFRDQTEERAAAAALQNLAARQTALLDAIPDMIMEVNADKVYTWANQAGIEFFGEDVIGKEASDFFEGEQLTYNLVQPLFNGSDEVIYVESWQRRKDGQKRLLAWWCRTLKDSTGKVVGALSSARDITERNRAEEELKASEAQFQQLFSQMQSAFAYHEMIYDADGKAVDYRFVKVNPAFEQLTGLRAADILGRTVLEVMPGTEDYWIQTYAKVVETGESLKFENFSAALNRYYEVRAYRPEPGYFATLFLDITERKQVEKLQEEYAAQLETEVLERTSDLRLAQEKLVRQERLAVLGQLAGGVGHEMRNPLGVMSNAVYFLKMVQPDAPEKVKEYLNILESEIATAEKIITDLLDFSRIRSVDRAMVPIDVLIARLLERYPPPAKVLLKKCIPDQLPPVFVDERQILQVLGNLALNAYQAMPEGGELEISVSQKNGMLAVAVKDTGIGITPENLGRLFEPLFTTKARGIGLGLAVSKKLLEANCGQIEVSSEVGRGTTFIVSLPINKEVE